MNKKSLFPKGSKIELKIENYLENNLDLIEKDLKLIKRQYKVYYKSTQYIGAIDLFCQGADGAQVVVELKSKELNARDLGQIMAYYAVCKLRADKHKLPPPRCYAIGLSVGPQYKLGLTLLHNGKDINLQTYTYKAVHGISISDKEFIIDIKKYNFEDEGVMVLKL